MKLDKNYKVRVTPEQSREIQELVFGLGGKWNGGTDWVINETIPFLYVTSGLVMTCDSKAQEYFSYASSENTEIQADDLIALLTDLPKSAENPLQDVELTPEFEALDKPQPDWSTAPDGFDWWAKDKDGTAYWFDDLPRKQGDCWGGPCNFEKTTINLNDKTWHESLERRPKVDAITATNDLDSRPMSTRTVSEPKFQVGDKVYVGLTGKIAQVTEIIDDDVVNVANKNNEVRAWISNICHATQENYERLQATFPHIKFERPLTQADIDNEAVDKLAQAMKNKLAKKREQGYHGWETCKHGDLVQLLINHVDKGDPIDVANFCAFLFARGEPLTEAVLDE